MPIEYTPILTTTVPAAIAGVVSYLIGRKKSNSAELIQKSKADAEIQTKALDIVKRVLDTMREEFIREIQDLKSKIEDLTNENEKLKTSIKNLDDQLIASGKLSGTLQNEITSLQRSLTAYKEENDKLKNL